MKKNIINFIGGIIIFDIGLELFHLSLSPSILEMSWLTSITMAIVLYFLGIFFILLGIGNIVLGLKAFWKWYSKKPSPFTAEEWKAVSAITSLRVGETSFTKKERKQIVKDMFSNRGDKIVGQHRAYVDHKKISIIGSFEILKDELLHSIQNLPKSDRKIEISEQGEFIKSPWLASRELYWKNRGFA